MKIWSIYFNSAADSIKDYFGIESALDLSPRYNIAPSQPALVIRQLANQSREFATLRWGLILAWIKEQNLHSAGWINVRIESAHEKPVFRQAFKHRRYLIVPDGFYEWQRVKLNSLFISIKKDKSLLAMAILWESWQDKKGHVIDSCAILTKQANDLLRPIHERMSAILEQNHFK